jgi:hypothetical protein
MVFIKLKNTIIFIMIIGKENLHLIIIQILKKMFGIQLHMFMMIQV